MCKRQNSAPNGLGNDKTPNDSVNDDNGQSELKSEDLVKNFTGKFDGMIRCEYFYNYTKKPNFHSCIKSIIYRI